jgi:SAM-dependent methyltransferase
MHGGEFINESDFRGFLSTVTFPYGRQANTELYHDVHIGRYVSTINALIGAGFHRTDKTLELAAAPYGMTAYLSHRLCADLTLASFGDHLARKTVVIEAEGRSTELPEFAFNIETDEWPFDRDTFDLIIACELVEHLAFDPMALFAGANRALKLGGRLFVSTPNAASLQNIIKLASFQPPGLASHFHYPVGPESLYQRHNREYGPHTLAEMFRAAGFAIDVMASDSAFPIFPHGMSNEAIEGLLTIVGAPELRRDTLHFVGRKISDVVTRHPTSQDLYVVTGR